MSRRAAACRCTGTSLACSPAGPFAGPMVVSMRPLKPADRIRAVQIHLALPGRVHGAPIHIGLPMRSASPISRRPIMARRSRSGRTSCRCSGLRCHAPGVIAAARPAFAITHVPGKMLVTDLPDHHFAGALEAAMPLRFTRHSRAAVTEQGFEPTALVIAGWTGRDPAAVQHHIDELAALGVPAPSTVPLFYRVAGQQLTQRRRDRGGGRGLIGRGRAGADRHGRRIVARHRPRTIPTARPRLFGGAVEAALPEAARRRALAFRGNSPAIGMRWFCAPMRLGGASGSSIRRARSRACAHHRSWSTASPAAGGSPPAR